MLEIKNHTVKTWYILTPSKHYGFVDVGQVLKSGQESLETFTDESEWIDRLNQLNIELND